MKEIITADLCIIGAGPAGLSAALAYKAENRNRGQKKRIIVIEKAGEPGGNTLSGAVMHTSALSALEQLITESHFASSLKKMLLPVQHDWMHFLTPRSGIRVPAKVLPKNLRHHNDVIIRAGELVRLLSAACEAGEIPIFTGIAASEIVVDGNRINAVLLPETGKNGAREKIVAQKYIFCDGTVGTLSEKLISEKGLKSGVQPQVYSVGVKQLVRLSPESTLREGSVIHSLGYPLPVSVFGGGFLYGLRNRHASVGMLIGLDYRYKNLNPVHELERLKKHPQIAALLHGHTVISCGVKTTPEGGYYSLPEPGFGNTLIAGDAGGFMNLFRFKGLHLAIASGIAAGTAAARASAPDLVPEYKRQLSRAGIYRELHEGRNFRKLFDTPFGFLLGAPLSLLQKYLPWTPPLHTDRSRPMRKILKRKPTGLSREDFVYLSRTVHSEDIPSHIRIVNTDTCLCCEKKYASPCLHFCPGKVYSKNESGILQIQHTNCLHDKTCSIKCPYDNIEWTPPPGGGGPRYSGM